MEKVVQALSDLKRQLSAFLVTNAAGWGWCICRWAIVQLGDMSAKYSARLNKVAGGDMGRGNIPNLLPTWLSLEGARTVTDLTTRCIDALKNCPDETERCVSVLLDTSVKHGANFDWAVAHVGGCFPDTLIARVLSVGLKDFVSAGDSNSHSMDIHEGEGLHLSKEPKMSSVAGILGHLATSHQPNLRRCLNAIVRESLMDDDCEEGSEEEERKVATLPYLLHLASLSDTLRSALTSEIRALFAAAPGVAAKIADLVPEWTADRYFPGPDNLAHHCVHLIIATSGYNGRDIMELLFDLSIDLKNASRAARDASHGCRFLLELLLSELLNKVHLAHKPVGNYPIGSLPPVVGVSDDLPILKSVSENYSSFVEKYLLTNDPFQRKCILLLANLVCLYKGRTDGVLTIEYGITRADDDEHCPDQLGVILQFVRDNEIWLPGIVDTAISQCIKLSLKSTNAFGREQVMVDPENFMDNLAAILHSQNVDEKKQPEGCITVSKFADCVRNHHSDLLPLLGHKNLIIKILKIFHFVPLPKDMSVSLMHKAAHSFVHTLLVLIEDHDEDFLEEEVRLEFMLQVMDILAHISYSHPFGLPMVLRFLMEAAIKSPFAAIFGGKTTQSTEPKIPTSGILQTRGSKTTLYEENLKFGAMPTHPLGTSTVFHAGVIGEGKRPPAENCQYVQEIIDSNTLTFVSLLFKLCHHNLSQGSFNNRENDQGREKSKEATKQLSLLLVDLISPDIMYNGLPWPDEEFTRVTMERDLIIVKTFEDHPILWKIMYGLAEARPSLCYGSVLIRAMLAVQMSHWQTSVVARAELDPKKLDVTKRIVQLMSVGQFIPPPLDSISEVLHVMHPFHVHCILVDVWNYVRDNVPSPVSFSSNADGGLLRDFEPYKNYKQYCERLRLVMIRHISQLSSEFKRFFVDVADKQEQTMKIAMEY